MLYHFLDIFFMILHPTIIVFNLFGWIWKNTRKANLILLLLTGLSWLILGIWYGLGYCPLTDWHFEVLEKLGYQNLPNSYIKYLIDRITGLDINADLVDVMTAVLFFAALIASVIVNVRDYLKGRKND
jgi:hypothetical protein